MASDRATQLFNEGVTASLNAADLFAGGDVEAARMQSQTAIDQFRSALKIDAGNSTIRGSLGHELYVQATLFGAGRFAEAAECFVEALRTEPDNVAFLCDLGMCQANQGDLADAQSQFNRALKRDDSPETREHIAMQLADMGRRAFDHGTSLNNAGDPQQGLEFKRFAIGASMLAYQIQECGDLARQVSTFAAEIGDVATEKRFAALAAR